MSTKPRKVSATADEALCLIEVSVIQPVAPSFPQTFEDQQSDQADGAASVVRRLQADSLMWLEQAIGLYSLYQYPLVWEPLGVHPVVSFVDLANKTVRMATRIEPDNFIPFRLQAGPRVDDGELSDQVLVQLGRLQGTSMHLPLLLLRRSLWHRTSSCGSLRRF